MVMDIRRYTYVAFFFFFLWFKYNISMPWVKLQLFNWTKQHFEPPQISDHIYAYGRRRFMLQNVPFKRLSEFVLDWGLLLYFFPTRAPRVYKTVIKRLRFATASSGRTRLSLLPYETFGSTIICDRLVTVYGFAVPNPTPNTGEDWYLI